MPYDTDNRSGITKNASESHEKRHMPFFVFLALSVLPGRA